METLRFKTSMKCNGCINAVKPGLDRLAGAEKWNVDLMNPDHVLEVQAGEEMSEAVMEAVKKAGYQISRL